MDLPPAYLDMQQDYYFPPPSRFQRLKNAMRLDSKKKVAGAIALFGGLVALGIWVVGTAARTSADDVDEDSEDFEMTQEDVELVERSEPQPQAFQSSDGPRFHENNNDVPRPVTLGQMQAPAPSRNGFLQLQGKGLSSSSLHQAGNNWYTGNHYRFTGSSSGEGFRPPVMGSQGWVDTGVSLTTTRGMSRDLRGSVHIPIQESDVPQGAPLPTMGPLNEAYVPVRNIKRDYPAAKSELGPRGSDPSAPMVMPRE